VLVKINLLPAHYLERKKVRTAWVVIVVLLLAEIGGLIYASEAIRRQAAPIQAQIEVKTREKSDLDALRASINQLNEKMNATKPLTDFIEAMMKFNTRRPEIYERAARYTDRDVYVLSMAAGANSFQMQAYVSDYMSAARFLRYMNSNPDFATVAMSAVPSFAEMEQRNSQRLLAEIQRQMGQIQGQLAPPGSFGAFMPPGGPSEGLMPPGGGPAMGGFGGDPTLGGAMAGNGPAFGGPPGGFGDMGYPGGGPPGMPGRGGMAGPGAPGGFDPSGGRQGATQLVGLPPLALVPPSRWPKGFVVTLNAVLREPITRPTYGSAAQQLGGGGGFGGPGGPPGMGGPPGLAGAGFGPGGDPTLGAEAGAGAAGAFSPSVAAGMSGNAPVSGY